ncbi:MAG: tetratricopeptide repeat protein, partial [Gemmatimonadota bacterium]
SGGALVPVDLSRVPQLEGRIAADSTDVEAMNELAHIYVSTQQFREAADLSMRALRVDPENAQAMTHLGVVLWASGDLDAAVEAFDHAIQFDPGWHETYLFKGLVLFTGKQDFQGAVETWERYLEVAPPDVNTDRVRGMLEGARQGAARGRSPAP